MNEKEKTIYKIKVSGKVVDITYFSIPASHEATVKKIDEKNYMVLSTGEVREYTDKAETRADNYTSIRRTFRMIADLINANVTTPENCKWCTLTYKENMKDPERLYHDFRKFNQRFQRRYGKAEYIAVAEPQERGAWHLHVIYIWQSKAPFIPNEEFEKVWSHGFTWLTKMENVDNIGAYLSAYLGNMPKEKADEEGIVYEDRQITELEYKGEKKKFIKGARLTLYPAGFRIYRHSRDIKKPEVSYGTWDDVMRAASGLTKTYDTGLQPVQIEELQAVRRRIQYKPAKVLNGQKR